MEFNIRRLARDADALILYGLAVIAAMIWLLAPDPLFDRIMERGRLAIAVFGLPALAATWRMLLRRSVTHANGEVEVAKAYSGGRREDGRVDESIIALLIAAVLFAGTGVLVVLEVVR